MKLMTRMKYKRKAAWLVPLLLMDLFVLPKTAPAQEEVASAIRRFKEREYSTGYYEEYEAKPKDQRPLVGVPGVRRGLFPYSPFGAQVRIRTRLADSHQYIKFYQNLRCEFCHIQETKDIHTTRANLTCRQCHGGEPIASINHFFSPMNPIRRHAYVCAKCHQGANASFASYIVHEPPASSLETRKTFPVLFYSYWFMLLLLIGVLVFFLPHGVMVLMNELAMKKGKRGIDIAAFYIPRKYRERMRERASRRLEPAVERLSSLEGRDLTEALKNFFVRKPKAMMLKVTGYFVRLFSKKRDISE